jgi:hypothetical protein
MKLRILSFAATTMLAVSAVPADPYPSITAQVFSLTQASGCEAGPTRRLPVGQALAFYDRLAKNCAALYDHLWKLDLALMGVLSDTPVSPLDGRMRDLRMELAERLAAIYNRTRDPGEGAARQADLLEMARLTRLIHMVDMETAEAANQKLADSKDTRVAAALQALRLLEGRVESSAAQAAAIVEAIRQTTKRRFP